jgi:hypothetical protein
MTRTQRVVAVVFAAVVTAAFVVAYNTIFGSLEPPSTEPDAPGDHGTYYIYSEEEILDISKQTIEWKIDEAGQRIDDTLTSMEAL